MKWPIAKINAVKDLLAALIFVTFLLTLVFLVMPNVTSASIGTLRESYLGEQKDLVVRAVRNMKLRAETLYTELVSRGLSDAESRQVLFELVSREKYGTKDFGYFYIVDTHGYLILHPYQKELQGKRLDEIKTPNGKSMDELYSRLLSGERTGFIRYFWWFPDKTGGPEEKTAYFETSDRLGWILVSGFYHSDFQSMMDTLARVTRETIGEYQGLIFILAAVYLLAIALLSWYVFLRMRAIERSLIRQIKVLDQYKLILDASSIVSRTDRHGVITYVNSKFSQVTGYTADQAIGHKHNIERHPDTPIEVFKEMWGTITQGRVWTGILKNRRADGRSYFKQATIVPLLDESHKVFEYLSSGQDVTDLLESRDQVEQAFRNDPLTGLGNRLRLLGDLEQALRPGLVLVDVENFSGLNQAFGTSSGDLFLKELANRLFDIGHPVGFRTYRIEADVFCYFKDCGGFEEMERFLDSLPSAFENLWIDLGAESVPLVVRMGASYAVDNPYLCAEAALKSAKTDRSLVHLFAPGESYTASGLSATLQILKKTREAYFHNRIVPVFQPIIDLKTGEIEKFECLMRAKDSDGTLLLPSDFIPVSKKTNLYRLLTRRIIEKATEALMGNAFTLSVNLTVEDLMDDTTVDFLLEKTDAGGFAPRLIVEIVESEELKDLEKANRSLGRFRQAGIGLAVDDFGSGYSNFDYLLKINPSYIKIDGSITVNLLKEDRARQLVSSIVQFARSSGMQTVAEHIDSAPLRDEVSRLGVDYGQGWFFGVGTEMLP